MRQAGFEPTTVGSGGGTGQRPPTLAVVVSGTYACRASASASQRRPRCYRRCYRGSPLLRFHGAATPCTYIRRSNVAEVCLERIGETEVDPARLASDTPHPAARWHEAESRSGTLRSRSATPWNPGAATRVVAWLRSALWD